MKFFGEFLVERNIISKETLIESLIEQIRSLEPLSSIVYSQKLLLSDQILAVFAKQTTNQVDFKTAAKDLGFWSDEVDQKVQEWVDGQRIPLGQILVKNGKTDLATLTKALDEFLSKYSSVGSSQPPKINNHEKSASLAFAPLDSSLVHEFTNSLNPTKIDEMTNLISLIEQNSQTRELVQEFYKEVHKNIHSFRGMARLAQLTLSERLLLSMEKPCLDFLRSVETGAKAEALAKTLSRGIKLLNEVREALVQGKNEEWIWNSPERSHFETFLKEMGL